MKITALPLKVQSMIGTKWGLPSRSFMRSRAFYLLPFLLLALSFLFFAHSAHAYEAGPEYSSNSSNESSQYSSTQVGSENDANPLNTNSNVPNNLHSLSQIVFIEIMSTLSCQLAGIDPLSADNKCLGIDTSTGKIGFVNNEGGLLGVVSKGIDLTFTPPVATYQYVAYMRGNFGIVKSAYAQETDCVTGANGADNSRGLGYCGLQPVLKLWIAMRNIVYLIMILAFVIIGLGIMLRIHIDPRTVMTVQNQIPKIIIGILAITFSFAIAGLLVDVMFVAVYLFAGVISSVTTIDAPNTANMIEIITAANPFDAANSLHGYNPDGTGGDGILFIASETSKAFTDIVKLFIAGSLIQGNGLVEGIVRDFIGVIASIIFFIFIIIALIIVLFRLWITLILAYVNIILDVIFAPFWILAGILPGSSMGLGGWLRDLIANLAVYPVAISFFLLANYFLNQFGRIDNDIYRLTPPLMGGTNPAAISALIGFGFIMMLPGTLKTVKSALKAPNMSFGPIFQPVGAAAGGVMSLPKRGMALRERYQYNQAAGHGRWRSLTGNPLLANPPSAMKPSHGGGGGGGSSSSHATKP